MTELVDTILFQWGRESGIAAVGGSMPQADLYRWGPRLLRHVSLPEGDRVASTAYLRTSRDAILLHREPVNDGLARESTRTSVLVGPPSVITFDRAVRLRRAPVVDDEPPVGYPPEWLEASDRRERMRHDLHEMPSAREALVTLVDAIMCGDVRTEFAVRTTLTIRASLLWAACECLGDQARRASWSFSTSLTSDERDHAILRPRFMFVGDETAPGSMGTTRRKVDLSKPPGNDQAYDLVDRWWRGVPVMSPVTHPTPPMAEPERVETERAELVPVEPEPERTRPRFVDSALAVLAVWTCSAVFIALLPLIGGHR